MAVRSLIATLTLFAVAFAGGRAASQAPAGQVDRLFKDLRWRNIGPANMAGRVADIEAVEVFPDLRRAYDERLVDPRVIGRSELDDVEASRRGSLLARMQERQPPIDDVAEATSWWAQFERRASSRRAEELAPAAAGGFDFGRTEPYRAPQKVGRNEPCPCGSGKKYKKCCGR